MAKRRANGEGSLRFDEKTKKWIATITVDKKRKAFYGKTRQEAINKERHLSNLVVKLLNH